MTDVEVGPIDFLAVEFPDGQLKGEGLAEIIKLVDAGIIRVLDLRVVRREQDGTFTAALIADFDNDGTLDLAVFAGVESGLIADEDLEETAELLAPGTAAAVIVYENSWAGPFVAAMHRAGAEVLATGRIPAADVIAALDALEEAEQIVEAEEAEAAESATEDLANAES